MSWTLSCYNGGGGGGGGDDDDDDGGGLMKRTHIKGVHKQT